MQWDRGEIKATKFVVENGAMKQIDHVVSEWEEFLHEPFDGKKEKEEAIDLYHSLETLFRIWECEGVDMEAVQQKVYEKNRERGYYPILNKGRGEQR